jgi:hypothetical protein
MMDVPYDEPFPLDVWFDLRRRISQAMVTEAAAQIVRNAVQSGCPPDDPLLRCTVWRLRVAAQGHNRRFPHR